MKLSFAAIWTVAKVPDLGVPNLELRVHSLRLNFYGLNLLDLVD